MGRPLNGSPYSRARFRVVHRKQSQCQVVHHDIYFSIIKEKISIVHPRVKASVASEFQPYDRAPLGNFSLVTMIHTAGRPVSTNGAAIIHHRPEWRGPQFRNQINAQRNLEISRRLRQHAGALHSSRLPFTQLNFKNHFHQALGPTTDTFNSIKLVLQLISKKFHRKSTSLG